MTTLDKLWADYEAYHQTKGNQLTHMVGIPLIILGLIAVFSFHIGGGILLSQVLLVIFSGVYLWLDIKLGVAMVILLWFLYYVSLWMNWQMGIGVFLFGWILQFIGHGVYEKKQPAFFKNGMHLLVGPMWVLNHFIPLKNKK